MVLRSAEGLRARFASDDGATATEYAIMASFVAVVIAAAVGALGQAVNADFLEFVTEFGAAVGG